MACDRALDGRGLGDATCEETASIVVGDLGVRDHGARRAVTFGAGFHHLMDASIAFNDRVRKGS